MALLYGLNVPNWAFDVSGLSIMLPRSLEAGSQTVSQSKDASRTVCWAKILFDIWF